MTTALIIGSGAAAAGAALALSHYEAILHRIPFAGNRTHKRETPLARLIAMAWKCSRWGTALRGLSGFAAGRCLPAPGTRSVWNASRRPTGPFSRRRWSARLRASACSVKVLQWLSPHDIPWLGQLLFFVAIVVPFTIFLTVLMVPRLGSLREITVAILGLYPAMVYRMSSPLVLAGYDEHQHAQSLMNLLLGSGLFSL